LSSISLYVSRVSTIIYYLGASEKYGMIRGVAFGGRGLISGELLYHIKILKILVEENSTNIK
jgi:hypothetical protein